MATLTIADAARRCGVARRTLQRAIRTGRLPLTPDHRVTLAALQQAGYRPVTSPQEHVAATPQRTTQEMSQALAPLVARIDTLIARLDGLTHALAQLTVTATPRRRDAGTDRSDRPRRQTAATDRGDTPAPQALPYDPTRFVLGPPCPRGHLFGDTGLTLRRIRRHDCPQCSTLQKREARRRRRERTEEQTRR